MKKILYPVVARPQEKKKLMELLRDIKNIRDKRYSLIIIEALNHYYDYLTERGENDN